MQTYLLAVYLSCVLPYGYTYKTTRMLLDKLWKEYFVSIAEYKQGDRNFTDKLKIRYINPAAVTVLLFPHISHIKKSPFTSLGKLN